MKKITSLAIFVATLFYLMYGLIGYASFENDAPKNWLIGLSYIKSFRIVDFTNICIIVQLVEVY